MKRRTAVLLTIGLLALGGLVVAVPAVAGDDWPGDGLAAFPASGGDLGLPANGPGPGSGPGSGPAPSPGDAAGRRIGLCRGAGLLAGICRCAALVAPKGTLTEEQKSALATVAERKKAAYDLYKAFSARYEAAVFERIAVAEARHLAVTRALLKRYGLADPTADRPAGQFSDAAVAAQYDRLLAQGQASEADALRAAEEIERASIDALQGARKGLTAVDVRRVYTLLLAGERDHLRAIARWLDQ